MDISQVSTEKLLETLKDRFDGFVFVGHVDSGTDSSQYYVLAPQDIHINYGLLEMAGRLISEAYEAEE